MGRKKKEYNTVTGERIAALLKQNHMTQRELARRLGIERDSTVSDWIRKGRTPQRQYLNQIAEIFDVLPDYLLGIRDMPGSLTGRTNALHVIDRNMNHLIGVSEDRADNLFGLLSFQLGIQGFDHETIAKIYDEYLEEIRGYAYRRYLELLEMKGEQ